ncbi:MAG: type III-A CRISPR-associated RAMP protein Csm4 [Chloroflexota bacterium]|nr:type III-A CRISPR-associated RAMP protein Csm4 [Chloroflexota bacterium]
MAQRRVYRLHAQRGFHFGIRGVGVEASALTAASDTLFGALCQALRATQGLTGAYGLQALLDTCRAGAPPFLLSSLFPYAGEVLLLPRPLPLFAAGAKAARKARYLSWNLFAAWIDAGTTPAQAAVFAPENQLHNSAVWVTAAERAMLIAPFADPDALDDSVRFWQTGDVPRVTVDRVSNAAQVYQAGRIVFPEGAGLYCLIEWRDPAWQPAIHGALAYLGEEGIGGERSAGYGQFTLEADATGVLGYAAPALPVPPGPAAAMTLALYYPARAEVTTLAQGRYDLTMRRGWVGAPGIGGTRWADVLMVAEGSVLPWPADELRGTMADVSPAAPAWPAGDPRIWRYGYGLPLAVPAGLIHEVPDATA